MFLAGGPGFFNTVEPLEDMREILGSDALPGIGHREGRAVGFRVNRHAHAAAGAVVADRVAHDVPDRLRELTGVAPEIGRRSFHGNADVFFVCQRLEQGDRFLGDAGQIAELIGFRGFVRVEPRQHQQGLDQPAHALGGALAGREAFAVFGGRTLAGQRRLRLREHHGHRGPQLVRGVGGELGLPGESGLEAGERVVEVAGELAELALAVGRADALAEVAVRDLCRGRADLRDRAQGARPDPPAAGQAEQENRAAGSGQQPRGAAEPGELITDVPADEDAVTGRGVVEGLAEISARPEYRRSGNPLRARDSGWSGRGNVPAFSIALPHGIIKRLARHAVEEFLFARRPPHGVRPRGVAGPQRLLDKAHALFELAVNAGHLVFPLEPPCGEPEARQHEREQQPVPELHPPADGVEESHPMQYPWPRRVSMSPPPSFLRRLETWTSSRFESESSSSSNRCS